MSRISASAVSWSRPSVGSSSSSRGASRSRARASARRRAWPADSVAPFSPTHVSRPVSRKRVSSFTCASACHKRASSASGSPSCRFSRTLPENTGASCGSQAMRACHRAASRVRRSSPAKDIRPDCGACSPSTSASNDDLPSPLSPATSTRSPGAMRSCAPSSTRRVVPGQANTMSCSSSAPQAAGTRVPSAPPCAAGASTTCCSRCAATVAARQACQAGPMAEQASSTATVMKNRPPAAAAPMRSARTAATSTHSIVGSVNAVTSPCASVASASRCLRRSSQRATSRLRASSSASHAAVASIATRSCWPSMPSCTVARRRVRACARSPSRAATLRAANHGASVAIAASATSSTVPASGSTASVTAVASRHSDSSASSGPMARTSRPSIASMSAISRAIRSPTRNRPSPSGASGSARAKNQARRSRAMRRVTSWPSSFSP